MVQQLRDILQALTWLSNPKYEYARVDVYFLESRIQKLNEWGADGWRVVTIHKSVALLERRVGKATTP